MNKLSPGRVPKNTSKVRNEVVHLILNEIPPERPLKFARLCDGRTFDPETGRWFETCCFHHLFWLFSLSILFDDVGICWDLNQKILEDIAKTLIFDGGVDVNQDTDYVSMVNKHLQVTRRPRSGQSVAQYRTISATAPFRIEIRIEQRVWQGLPQSKIKLAKQSATYEAWKKLHEGMPFSWQGRLAWFFQNDFMVVWNGGEGSWRVGEWQHLQLTVCGSFCAAEFCWVSMSFFATWQVQG